MLADRIKLVARAPVLLAATDFDGTISELVDEPDRATMRPDCERALERLAGLPRTRIAIISGRPLGWLRGAVGGLDGALLFGSHGAEDGSRNSACPNVDRGPILAALREISSRFAGTMVEDKPFGGALHYRRAGVSVEAAIRGEAERVSRELGVFVRLGSMVVELTCSPATKGEALGVAVRRTGASHAVFIGDDLTDEDAFAAMRGQDLSIRVGPGPSRAISAVAEPDEVADVLQRLAEERERWLGTLRFDPIQDHALLSDQRTTAIVSPSGRVVWMCVPRIDSPAIFAELIGGPAAGAFGISPADGGLPLSMRTRGDSFVLETSWSGLSVTDFLDCSGGRAFQRSGRTDLVRALRGKGRVAITFAPRLDFGRMETRLRTTPQGLEVEGGPDPIVLIASGVQWNVVEDGKHQTATGLIDLDAHGGEAVLELRYGTANLRASEAAIDRRIEENTGFWSNWAARLVVPARRRDALVRSALVIKALCQGPTGGIAAAATTSLPEHLGGSRNWDYRFCWPRDSAMSATALLRLGSSGHAMKLADWLLDVVDRLESPERLRPIYTVSGKPLGSEAELSELSGYGESRPVRISNGAAHQVQLDVFAPIVEMIALMTERGVPVGPDPWRLVRAMAQAVEARWREPDHGIWEFRTARRHYVHSKVMCWYAIDRALVVHEAVFGKSHAEWTRLRDEIAADVLARGWNERVGAFTLAYDSDELDASALMVGLKGLVSASDPRFVATVEAVNRDLRRGNSVWRYRHDDGLPGPEGGMTICATWLVEALALIGRIEEAEELLDGVCRTAGVLGLMSEQWDEDSRQALGNFPQAYSHLGVIEAALRLEQVRRREQDR
ncbi:MAG: trehalose-phosphatase [Phycisphaerales bacterium]|nr:trehalose-phosphatase [Phycisphaerales bacterium]